MDIDQQNRGAQELFPPSSDLRVKVSAALKPVGVLVALGGSLDTTQSKALLCYLEQLVDQIGPGDSLIIGLDSLHYISSTGIGCLTHILSVTTKRGISFSLYGMTIKVREVFSLLGFLDFFNFIDELEINHD
ncbi:MAG: hypothetical protein A2087_03225 [Spirochaetes bacterium GWD1_61_31]|nr:MAG: hypothetical protein A2Y37_12750 [Spirochaetes bacterium GWB1_60_80]OHD32928.1 MAG: hypothetical protein A2004_00955 [Spirochaetes bacterium GWC1_61_12]OHD38688.1 MAG: hypothetical protein A2087_03225 [Spirochaetes bacterium GWD1_61_31]OHD43203.1 MAG: hypothetical protein A2Y35_08205 [Spirochaetes bacterium GWE1_60_18]OHD58766.1 MAG: hypothetical protein A2Y32_01045 [Spirochaetes bacterium GWF1_60_12]HAP42677.1 hypothetical protein [Spirochaetaceae bacterium]